MFIRLWAFLTGGKLVWLKDFDGETALSIARVDEFGEMRAERHWPFKIRTCVLLEDGVVAGSHYVHFWKYA